MDKPTSTSTQGRLRLERYIRTFIGIVISVFLLWRIYNVLIVEQNFGADTWVRFGLSGLILGGMYSLIAIGYTLVYGIMFMINFAHGEVMMLGAFGGYFVFEALRFIPSPTLANPELNFLNAHPIISVMLAFLVGISVSATVGYFLEKIAYRPLRKAPRLILLITAIGASIVLQNVAMLLFGPQRKNVIIPDISGSQYWMDIDDQRQSGLDFIYRCFLVGAFFIADDRALYIGATHQIGTCHACRCLG